MLNRVQRRFTVWKQLRSGQFPWHGTTVYFPPGSFVATKIIRMGEWEPDVLGVLQAAARGGGVAFDVGANIGATALPLLSSHPDLRVVSIEPSPSVLDYLTRTQSGSPFRDRWTIIPKAVTAEAGGEIVFTRFPSSGGDVFEGIRNTGRGGAGIETRVPTTSIDAEWEALGRPSVSLLKIDVEGAELGVLLGAGECIRACRPAIVTEWCPANFTAYGHGPSAMVDAAGSVGYDAYMIPELTPAAAEPLLDYQLATRENLLLLPR